MLLKDMNLEGYNYKTEVPIYMINNWGLSTNSKA